MREDIYNFIFKKNISVQFIVRNWFLQFLFKNLFFTILFLKNNLYNFI